MSKNNHISCDVTSCIYNKEGLYCNKDKIKVTDIGEDKSNASCESFEKYNGFSRI